MFESRIKFDESLLVMATTLSSERLVAQLFSIKCLTLTIELALCELRLFERNFNQLNPIKRTLLVYTRIFVT